MTINYELWTRWIVLMRKWHDNNWYKKARRYIFEIHHTIIISFFLLYTYFFNLALRRWHNNRCDVQFWLPVDTSYIWNCTIKIITPYYYGNKHNHRHKFIRYRPITNMHAVTFAMHSLSNASSRQNIRPLFCFIPKKDLKCG